MLDGLDYRAAANCAGAYREWAARMGHPTRLWPDLSVGDAGLPEAVPLDSASLLEPVADEAALHDVVDRAEALFAGRGGGPVQVWSAWPTPNLSPRAYHRHQVPALLRPVSTDAPAPPRELLVRPARGADLHAAGRLIDEVFECGAGNSVPLVTEEVIGEDLEVFVGIVDDRVVATATAYVSDGLCGVYAVATAGDCRGRGYGEALSWAATLFRPDLPATLQASSMGLPVYVRMGYREFGHFDLWEGPRPGRLDPGA